MSTNQRFVLNEKRCVVDTLNPANSAKGYCHEDDAEDDRHLRERVLMIRLGDILDKLIIYLRPMKKLPSGEEYKPSNDEVHAISRAIFLAIRASHLSSYDPTLSIQHKFGGILKRQKKGMGGFTSLSLFSDDVECLLRDLYGDIEREAMDSVLHAVFSIVEAFTKYARPDLCKEHSDAVDLDYMFGIGVPEGYGISGSDFAHGMKAKFDLMVRAYEVLASPSVFSRYTVEFAKHFGEHWMVPNNDKEFLEMKKRFTEPEEFECDIPF